MLIISENRREVFVKAKNNPPVVLILDSPELQQALLGEIALFPPEDVLKTQIALDLRNQLLQDATAFLDFRHLPTEKIKLILQRVAAPQVQPDASTGDALRFEPPSRPTSTPFSPSLAPAPLPPPAPAPLDALVLQYQTRYAEAKLLIHQFQRQLEQLELESSLAPVGKTAQVTSEEKAEQRQVLSLKMEALLNRQRSWIAALSRELVLRKPELHKKSR